MTHEYEITGMTCSSCVAKVKSELLKLGDIISAEVRLQSPQAALSMTKHIAIATLQQAVSKAGNYIITESGHQDMRLPAHSEGGKNEQSSYFPIFLLFGFIAGTAFLVQAGNGSFDWMQAMTHFMAGFFLVFSFFKLMNLQGFAEGYNSYDVVAKRFAAWGYIYPFVELGLGIAFLTGFEPLITNMAAFIIMGVSTVGVAQSLLKKTAFQCACLGSVIKLPLSKVTLFEDLLMVIMSLIMISKMI